MKNDGWLGEEEVPSLPGRDRPGRDEAGLAVGRAGWSIVQKCWNGWEKEGRKRKERLKRVTIDTKNTKSRTGWEGRRNTQKRCGTKADYLLQRKADRERWLEGKTRGDNTSKSGASLKLPSKMAYNRTERKKPQDTCVLLVAGREMEVIAPEVHKCGKPMRVG
ncbi:hypothetical protein PPACK8108_LOCUS15254 [Phakopsora pachyrhizi]|uniref:Uncharacterized protein n=1 Tax=Phakopsora pachyrhizi TaxID=170000 RepID=A0AAV0B8J6_PHAPC|nr:hypothetical protein PPACK8108_LOCUS15254 [Phakopsora pachyrhizi]